jgi:hypothetical protein
MKNGFKIALFISLTLISALVFAAVNEWTDADGTGTESIDVSNTVDCSCGPRMAVGSDSNPQIVWQEGTWFIPWTFINHYTSSAPFTAAFDPQELQQLTITAEYSGSIMQPTAGLSFMLSNDSEIYYLRWDGSAWVDADGSGTENANVSNSPLSSSTSPSIALDSNNRPHIAWIEPDGLYYLEWNGSEWVDADGTGRESALVYPSSISYYY